MFKGDISFINPFLKEMKRNVRRWFINFFVFWIGLIGICIAASFSQYSTYAVICFIVWALIIFFTTCKNISKNFTLRGFIKDYWGLERIELFVKPYKKLRFLINLIFVLDALLLWPLTLPFKFSFWFCYRRIKKRTRKLRKKLLSGEEVIDYSMIDSDPFYSFLMKEGLYGDPETGKYKVKIEDFLEQPESSEDTDDKKEEEEENVS